MNHRGKQVVNERVQIVCLVIKFPIEDLKCPVVSASHSKLDIYSVEAPLAIASMQALSNGRVASVVAPRAPQPLRSAAGLR